MQIPLWSCTWNSGLSFRTKASHLDRSVGSCGNLWTTTSKLVLGQNRRQHFLPPELRFLFLWLFRSLPGSIFSRFDKNVMELAKSLTQSIVKTLVRKRIPIRHNVMILEALILEAFLLSFQSATIKQVSHGAVGHFWTEKWKDFDLLGPKLYIRGIYHDHYIWTLSPGYQTSNPFM